MRVVELWRFPIKSLQGQRLAAAEIGPRGIAGDRRWALFDVATGFGLTARRAPDLLFATGRLRDDGSAAVVLPDGTATSDDAVISDWLGRAVALRSTGHPATHRYESPDDDEDERSGGWHPWEGSGDTFHDSARVRVSLLGVGSIGSWDRRRFRANVVLDGSGEDDLVGTTVRLGGAVLDVGVRIRRCVMVTRPQPGGIARENAVLKTLHRERGGLLAIGATVREPGTVRVGDAVAQGDQ